MRRFVVQRQTDVTGISGTGIILYGVEWKKDGPCDVFWPKTETTGQYPSLKRLKEIHCYSVDGIPNAQVQFLDFSHRFPGILPDEEKEEKEDERPSEKGHGSEEVEGNNVW